MKAKLALRPISAFFNTTVTATASGQTAAMNILEYSGIATSGAYDTSAGANYGPNTVTTATTPTITTTNANDLVLGGMGYGRGANFGTITVATPYVFRSNASQAFVAEEIVSSAGSTVGAQFNWQFGQVVETQTIAFKGSGAGGNVGCGATTGGASQYDQSTCGNVGPFPAPANGTAINACGSLASGNYSVTGNIGASLTTPCITITSGPFTIDLAGHTVTGRIYANSVTLHGSHLYSSTAGGTVNCSDSSAVNPGCIFTGNSTDPASASYEVDHLTINNSDSSSANSARGLLIDWNPSSSSLGTGFAVKVHHITAVSATGPQSGRIANVWVNGNSNLNLEFNNNKLTCQSTASSCNSGTFYSVNNVKNHNNLYINQLITGSITGDTARAFICDTGVHGCEVYNNYFDTQDGRAVRLRDVNNSYDVVNIHDNLIDHIEHGTTQVYVAAIHVCDPDSGDDNGTGYVFQHNTINIRGGNGLTSRNCTNYPLFQNNTIGCITSCTGLLANIRTPVAGGTTSTFQFLNNAPIPLTSNPQINVENGAAIKYCNTGTVGVATGGSATNTCP